MYCWYLWYQIARSPSSKTFILLRLFAKAFKTHLFRNSRYCWFSVGFRWTGRTLASGITLTMMTVVVRRSLGKAAAVFSRRSASRRYIGAAASQRLSDGDSVSSSSSAAWSRR